MLVIRLTRIGKKNQPAYRVVLTEKTNPVRGKFIEILGSYNPRLKTKTLKAERIQYWLAKGAQTSATVHNLLVNEKIITGAKVKAWRPKKKTQEARKAKEAEAVKAAESPAEEKSASVETSADKPAEEAKAEALAEEIKEEKTAEEVKTE
ncbi:30S ribosomal protein S16 [Patescibacteria group bacterium]|nr:30S ribosomal protein S16 [Patescibacteria group bacterium]MBU2219702.1 30S ribosomal protein S16 [Patescibacteria group bacterium]